MATLRWRLDDLGWLQFEELCQALLKSTFGVGIEAWGGHSDLGRDAYYACGLRIVKSKLTRGPFVFQAKFVAGANAAGAKPHSNLIAAARAERDRIHDRKKNKQWSRVKCYVLMTNVPLTAKLRKQVTDILAEELPSKNILLWGALDLSAMLAESAAIRRAFPQLLGIADLQTLLSATINAPTLALSRAAADKAKDLAPVFVPTDAYYKALSVASKHGFVVLTGPPEMGKSTIAHMMGLAKLNEGWEFYLCRTPDDFLRVAESGERAPKVVVADDAFGSTEYRPDLAQLWGDNLEHILRMVNSQTWLVFTSRSAPLKVALRRMQLEGHAEHFPNPAQVVVDASELTVEEKAKILYRHCKAAGLAPKAKSIVKTHAESIVDQDHFTPERIRLFIQRALPEICAEYMSKKRITQAIGARVVKEIQRPTVRMQKSFDQLQPTYRRFLVSLLDAGPGVVRSADVSDSFCRHAGNEADADPETIAADMTGHFLSRGEEFGFGARKKPAKSTLQWIHPSWRDLVIESLMRHTAKRKHFLERCSIDGILLALSTGGGQSGERRFPLLKVRGDWQALSASVSRLFQEADSRKTLRALQALAYALDAIEDTDELKARGPLNELTKQSLAVCKEVWDANGGFIGLDSLQLYYRVSLNIRPLPPSPHLERTWQAHWEDAETECSGACEDADCTFDGLLDFLRLASLLEEHEPRFLRQVRFPDEYRLQLARLVEEGIVPCDTQFVDPEESLYEDEIERWETFDKVLGLLGDHIRSLKKKAKASQEAVTNYTYGLQRDVEELHPGDGIPYDADEYRSSGEFDVAALFEDL